VKGSARRPGVFMRSFLAAEVSDANLDCVEQIQARGGWRAKREVRGRARLQSCRKAQEEFPGL
jgi:hypothetical protein